MSVTLVDTNILIALVDRSDALHTRAARDLAKLAKADFRVTSAVLTEAVFALPKPDQRGRLALLLDRLVIANPAIGDELGLRRSVFAWLARYADHDPDYADAELCVIAGHDRRARIWTYDSEFKNVWRKPDGRRLLLVGQ